MAHAGLHTPLFMDMRWISESPPTYALSSSGGKDSLLALHRATDAGLHVSRLLTLYDEATERVRFHGVPVAVMRAQADLLGRPLTLAPTTPGTFERVFVSALADLRAEGFAGLIFGNIHLADVRAWYEERVRAAGLEHVEPLWGEAPASLARQVVRLGYQAILTCVEEASADPAWLGQPLSEALIAACERRGIDPCGERGEYHTLICAGPLLRAPLRVRFGEAHTEAGFRQLDVGLEFEQ
jgi:diphthine-ammonia ligase